ncbi:zinc finger protein 692-like isoform X3 [Lethenteron reissneri]|uniref:zinc finger protein 692-like isoform X3 n=1 Tax=Lethenteron reissneri TaxID=7753 RepID=UPI002AB63CC7|nr:zinc finger protein 692-like isoform X3 [Lethenteron reissneri]
MGRRTGRPPGRTPVYASEAERRAARTRRDAERKRRSVHVGRHKERWDAAKRRTGTARDEDFAGQLLALLDRAAVGAEAADGGAGGDGGDGAAVAAVTAVGDDEAAGGGDGGGGGGDDGDAITAAAASVANTLSVKPDRLSKNKASQTRIKSESSAEKLRESGRTRKQNGSDIRPVFKEHDWQKVAGGKPGSSRSTRRECATSKNYKEDDDSGDESEEAEGDEVAEEHEDEHEAVAAAAAAEKENQSKHSAEEDVAADEGKSSGSGSSSNSSSSSSNRDDEEAEDNDVEDDDGREADGTANAAAVVKDTRRDAYDFGGSDDNAEEEVGACGECGSGSSVESDSDYDKEGKKPGQNTPAKTRKGAKDIGDDNKPKKRKYQKKDPMEPTTRKVRRKTKQMDADGLPVLYHCTQLGCEKVYRVKEYLTNHVKAVHGDRKLVCGMQGCGKRFVLPRHLKKHQLLHSDERNFVCETCGASFKSKKNLLIHLRIHTGEKPLQCELCGYRCRQKASLNWHMRKHNIELSFSFACDLCGKRFEKSDNLRCHQLKSHPDREPGNPYPEAAPVQPHAC